MRRHLRSVWLSLALAGCVVETETVVQAPPPPASREVPPNGFLLRG